MAFNYTSLYDLNSTEVDYLFNNFTSCSLPNCTSAGWSPTNPTNLTKEAVDPFLVEFQEQSRFWVQRVLVPIIMIIGVIGNTMTIFIMTQRRMRSSTNWYLAALAIFDMSYLVFSFVLSFRHYPHIHEIQYYLYWKLQPYLLTITDASSNTSVWITVTFTIERYIAVCHPMKGKVICTESRAKKMIIFVFLFSFLMTLPTAFEWVLVETIGSDNVTRVSLDLSELGHNPTYKAVYYWSISVLFIIIPIILLAIFNAFLIQSVHSSKTQRKTMTRRRDTGDNARQESKITIMLIVVVILFLTCQLPTAIILLYSSFHQIKGNSNEEFLVRALGNIFNFLVALNAAGNFVVYCLLSQKYRRTLVMMFCPCLKGKITRIHSAYQNTVYSTMDNESPHSTRKYSCTRKKNKNESVLKPLNPGSVATTGSLNRPQQQLSFSKKVAIYEDGGDSFPAAAEENSHNRRLLRGFRCPWKRPKIATTGNAEDERTGQFIPLKSPSKPSFESNVVSSTDNST